MVIKCSLSFSLDNLPLLGGYSPPSSANAGHGEVEDVWSLVVLVSIAINFVPTSTRV